MRNWILAIATVSVCTGTVVWALEKHAVPRMLASANAEIVADWHEAILQHRAENGRWARIDDPAGFAEDIFVVRGADDRRIPGGYMHGRASVSVDGIACDAYRNPLRFEIDGEVCTVTSAGADGVFGTEDDVTSKTAVARYTPTTLEQARARAAARVAARNALPVPGNNAPPADEGTDESSSGEGP